VSNVFGHDFYMPKLAASPELKYIVKLDSGSYRLRIRTATAGTITQTYKTLEEAQTGRQMHIDNAAGRLAPGSTLQEAWDIYEKSSNFTLKSKKTRLTRQSSIKPVLKKLGLMSIRHITAQTVQNYVSGQDMKLSSDTRRLQLDALSSTLKYARILGAIPANPCIGISRPPGGHNVRTWTDEERGLLLMLSSCPDWSLRKVARFLLLVQALRCRPGELAAAHWTDCDLKEREIRFRETKNGSDRTISFSPETGQWLADVQADELEQFADSPHIFSSRSPRPGPLQGIAGPYNWTSAIGNARKRHAALPTGLTGRTGRHDGITELVKTKATRGLSTEAMMLITGHRSYEAFRIYDHAKATAFRAEVDASEPERNETRIKGMAALLGVSVKEVKEKLAAKQKRLTAAAKLTGPARLTGPREAKKGGAARPRKLMQAAKHAEKSTPSVAAPKGAKSGQRKNLKRGTG